jgi:hypothetical protein
MHLDDERVQRLLHNELHRAGEQAVRMHLAECRGCRDLVEDARAEESRIFELLRQLDHSPASVDPLTLFPAVAARRWSWERWAAGLLLVVLAGGAAYAVPGSPLPGVLERIVGRGPRALPQTATEAPERPQTPAGAGIALAPGSHLTIRFLAEGGDAVATLSLTEGEEVTVRAVEGTASFSSEQDRLTIRSAGPVRFEISIPRSSRSLDVLAGDTPVLRKRAADVVTDAPGGPSGGYTLLLAPPP